MPAYPGNILTATPATTAGQPTPSRTWQWLRNGSPIAIATASTYVVQTADAGTDLQVVQTETNFLGTTSATSAAEPISAFSPSLLFATSEPGAWYDPSDLPTLFQDSAGTTPVTAAGQQVALMLDKSQQRSWVDVTGAVWTRTAGDGVLSVVGNTITITGATTTTTVTRTAGSIPLVPGRARLVVTATWSSAAGVVAWLRGSPFVLANGVQATLGNSLNNSDLERLDVSSGTVTFVISAFQFWAGNHASQATPANRPTYGVVPATGRLNLLTFSEDFSNIDWNTASGATATANSITFAANTISRITRSVPSATGLSTATASVRFSTADAGKTITLGIWTTTLNGVSSGRSPNLTIPADGVVTYTWTSGVSGLNIFGILTDTAGGVKTVTLASGGGAQLEAGTTATAYQRVVTAFDVTQAGVQSLSYLSFDGSNDSMATGTITPGIDKAQVFAGVQKLSDAVVGVFAETSVDSFANNGTLAVFTPSASNGRDYLFRSKGTVSADATAATFTAPITNVFTGIGDIAGDVNTVRVNGLQAASNAGNQGTGNFLAYPFYIGARAGSSIFFNGNLFSLILRFGTNLSAATIRQTETWVGDKTGINIPLSVSPTIFDRFNDTVLDRDGQTIEVR